MVSSEVEDYRRLPPEPSSDRLGNLVIPDFDPLERMGACLLPKSLKPSLDHSGQHWPDRHPAHLVEHFAFAYPPSALTKHRYAIVVTHLRQPH